MRAIGLEIDLTEFWRPWLRGQVSRHYHSTAQKALPAMVFSIMSIAGGIGTKRLPLLCALWGGRERTGLSPATAGKGGQGLRLGWNQGHGCGFPLGGTPGQASQAVCRAFGPKLYDAPELPANAKAGRPAAFGERIRPLARTYRQKLIPATKDADASGEFHHQERTIGYRVWHQLVTSETKVDPANATVSLNVLTDPLYTEPLILATDVALTAKSVFLIYLERWLVEHPPLAAKQMIGLQHQFVFAQEARFRLPELALLAGNILAHVAAQLPPLPTGFWDRAPQPTPGLLRRLLSRALFPNLGEIDPKFRKKTVR
jgi:hypothetical protein